MFAVFQGCFSGSVIRVNDDGSAAILYDGGKRHEAVPRQLIQIDHSGESTHSMDEEFGYFYVFVGHCHWSVCDRLDLFLRHLQDLSRSAIVWG